MSDSPFYRPPGELVNWEEEGRKFGERLAETLTKKARRESAQDLHQEIQLVLDQLQGGNVAVGIELLESIRDDLYGRLY